MVSLHSDESAALAAIADALVRSIPEDWDRAQLEVTLSEGSSYAHVISGPTDTVRPVVPSDALFEATRGLELLYAQKGHRYTRFLFRLELDDDDTWVWNVSYSY